MIRASNCELCGSQFQHPSIVFNDTFSNYYFYVNVILIRIVNTGSSPCKLIRKLWKFHNLKVFSKVNGTENLSLRKQYDHCFYNKILYNKNITIDNWTAHIKLF